MDLKDKQQKRKKKGHSVQELIGVKTFTNYGLATDKGELLFYQVAPTNISVLSHVNIEIKIRHLMMVLSSIPDIEITCTDSSECFDDNKAYLNERLEDRAESEGAENHPEGCGFSRSHPTGNGDIPAVFVYCKTEKSKRKAGL